MQQFERRLIGAGIGVPARDDRRVGKAQDQQSECSQAARHRETVFPSEMRTRHFGRLALYGLAGELWLQLQLQAVRGGRWVIRPLFYVCIKHGERQHIDRFLLIVFGLFAYFVLLIFGA